MSYCERNTVDHSTAHHEGEDEDHDDLDAVLDSGASAGSSFEVVPAAFTQNNGEEQDDDEGDEAHDQLDWRKLVG